MVALQRADSLHLNSIMTVLYDLINNMVSHWATRLQLLEEQIEATIDSAQLVVNMIIIVEFEYGTD